VLITQIVKASAHRLTDVDHRIVAELQARPTDAAFARAADITAPLGLHESAATRLAQRLGFEGYPQLREALREDYLGGEGPAQRVRSRLERGGTQDVLGVFVDDEVDALRAVTLHVRQDELDALASDVLAARDVYLFGQGNAVILVEQLGRRLTRFGIHAVPLTGSRRDIAERAVSITGQDTVVAFAFHRTPAVLPGLLSWTLEAGAPCTLVTDTLLTLVPAPDRVIAAPRGRGGEFLSLTVPMAIGNALVLTIARRSPETALRSLHRLEHVLERLDP